MHPSESKQERDHLRKALIEAQKSQDRATGVESEDAGRRLTDLMQRYRLCGGNLSDLPGHKGRRWKR
jgi:hypothetical protein